MEILEAETAAHYAAARILFEEHAAGVGHDMNFQGFAEELESLPGLYTPPRGCLLLARDGETWVGCVALRPCHGEQAICEMKRMYVRPAFRGRGLGRQMAVRLLAFARAASYRAMRLDTLGSMTIPRALYQSLGFREIPAYYHNPIEGVVYYELSLAGP